jgi:predicted transcriptional regulator
MSSYIPKQPKRERGQISIKLDRDVLHKLEQYGRFLESSRDYIINAALELVFRRDKSFSVWLETEQASRAAAGSRVAADPSVKDRSQHAAKQPDRNVTPGSNSEA